MQTVAVINYGMGNLQSVKKKLDRLKVNGIITSDKKEILAADKIILPGVGHFAKAMDNLRALDLIETLNEAVLVNKTPILGICLGMQLMAKNSEEGEEEGLGWFDAEVVKLSVTNKLKYKIPHIGWNQIYISKPSMLMRGIENGAEFYFVHSYHVKLMNTSEELNTTEYETNFSSAIEKDTIFGVQFHPEKSHDVGELLLKNFIEM